MSWKLRTEIDLNTGRSCRFFVYETDEGNIELPESLGFLLIKDMLKTFPAECQVLVEELSSERMEPAPVSSKVLPVTPKTRTFIDEEEEQAPETTPLNLPDHPSAMTLGDMAPKNLAREKDVPQG